MPCIASCRTDWRTFPGSSAPRWRLYTPLQDNWGEIVIRQGQGMPSMDEQVGSSWDHVSPDIWKPWASRFCAGAASANSDTASTQNVAVVDETFVQEILQAR